MLEMKFCTNCGAQLEAEDKFCTSCGTAVAANTASATTETPENKINVDKEAVNERVQQTKQYAQNYWNWVKTSIQKPFETQNDAHPFYGMTTFILFSIIGALFVVIPGGQIFGKFSETTSHYGVNTESIMDNPFTIGMFFKLLVVIAIIYALYIVIGYLVEKLLSTEDSETSVIEYTNKFAHFINYTLIFSVVALVITIFSTQTIVNNLSEGRTDLGSLNLVVGLLALASLGFSTGFLATFFDKNVKYKIDRIYVVVIAQLVVSLVIYILVRYMIVPNAESYATGLFGSVFSTFDNLF
ncbi:zinc-ribbon domain-containing protein [Pediococcus pentosaceus]|jgi:DNA-directed RNA polymerase subunit M/transcription elongation factor TFIIS|uniref:Zinc ribbon domain-containing protein n=3 Tax=Pediococcus pentosaceus TaxID=1255 RepID=A0AA40X935_PEDPE|nr:zinc-ribbon domain-containing protein [Pediococcus pentosaceus]KAF0423236.1 zinc-ribbon domain-containing protein [Pediococcus pentosaceus]MBF7106231.1 zinc ribbon domain-containing protein [Pediococcus pentosaceus]MBF7108960.1 zinc ribbon domain-containing protein [Pediococcus pentosaceus]MBF7119837.1 zinc ribbon domain-containing protein [Pediococcus pentosaceus]